MKKKRTGLKVVLICLLVLILVPVLVVGGLLIGGNKYLNDRLDHSEITGDMDLSIEDIYGGETVGQTAPQSEIDAVREEFEEAQKLEYTQLEGVDNILLIGADRRDKLENGRSDTMIIVSMNHNTGKIHMTSLMRAMYVCIPRSDGDVWGMLNAAYSWGGPNLLVDTIELNFRIQIDKYVVIDFAAFENVVNLLDGVEIELTEAEAKYMGMAGVYAPAGKTLLNGEQALMYSRIRMLDNDFVRTSRQRKVINELLKKARKMDLTTMLALADQILPMVNTNLTNSEILVYLTRAIPMLKNEVTQRMLPVENESGKSYYGMIYVDGREMYRVNFTKNIQALYDFINS